MAQKKTGNLRDVEGLDRRSFLKISSAAAVAATVAAAPALATPEAGKKTQRAEESQPGKPNLKGGWFSI